MTDRDQKLASLTAQRAAGDGQVSGHTPGPWEVDNEDNGETGAERFNVYLIGADNGAGKWATIATTHSSDLVEIQEEWDGDENGPWVHRWDAQGKANAARIVACVNALEGMNPDAVAKLVEVLQKIADAPAWGAPDRWETTPAEVRILARTALAELTGDKP